MVENVSGKFQQAFGFGFGLFVLNLIMGTYWVVSTALDKARKRQQQYYAELSPNSSFQPLGGSNEANSSIKCCISILSLAQVILSLVYRCSHGGRVCSGDYLKTSVDESQLKEFYLIDEGRFLFIAPIVQLCSIPLCCCFMCFFLSHNDGERSVINRNRRTNTADNFPIEF